MEFFDLILTGGQVCLRQQLPLPRTLLSVIPDAEMGAEMALHVGHNARRAREVQT